MRAVFLDKDGTLVEDIPYNIDPRQMKFLPGVKEGLGMLKRAGFGLVIISNQSGVARGYFSEADLIPVWSWLEDHFDQAGAPLLDILYCPHHPAGTISEYALHCDSRKPNPGMLLKASKQHEIDLKESWMIGDILDDVEAGNRAGCRSILINSGNETEWEIDPTRKPEYMASDFLDAVAYILTCSTRQLENMAGFLKEN